jgi:hypothetical protein
VQNVSTVLVAGFTAVTVFNVFALPSFSQAQVGWDHLRSGLTFSLPEKPGALTTALATFGIRPASPTTISMPYVAAVSLADTALLLVLIAFFIRARGEDPISLRATYQKDNLDDLGDTMVSTNSHQQDRGILDKCEKAFLMFQRGRDINTIAIKQAVGPQIVRNRLKIHALDAQLKEALYNGACTQAQALEWADKPAAEQHAAGIAYLAAAEDPKPRASKEPAPERVRRKRRSESTLRRATVDGSEARKAVAAWMLEPSAPVEALLTREDLPEVIREMAWALGEETT